MERNEILIKMQEIFRAVMKNPSMQLAIDMTPENIPEWDSLAHTLLITTIEQEFGIKFSLREMLELDSVDGILSSLQKKLQ